MIVAISMFKDEADIAAATVAHLLSEGVDHIIVADNLSTDGTRDILSALAAEHPITVMDDDDPAHYQSRKMTRLANLAGEMGADWVLPFDADELWYSAAGRLSEVLPAAVHDIQWGYCFEHVPTDDDDPSEANPVRRIGHRRPQPKPMMKVAFRYQPGIRMWEGNHDVDHTGTRGRGLLHLREFQYRTLEQTMRKVRNGKAALEATTLAVTEGSHWRQMGGWSDDELERWWKDYRSQPVVYDPAPLR